MVTPESRATSWSLTRAMRGATARRRVRWVLNALLLLAVVGTIATGIFTDRLDLNQFVLHARLGYAMAVLIAIHVALHWRAFKWPGSQRETSASSAGGVESLEALGHPIDDRPSLPGPRFPQSRMSRRAALVGAGGLTGIGVGWFGRGAVEPSAFEGGDVGMFYHRESSLGPLSVLGSLLDWGPTAPRYKSVEGAVVPLPAVDDTPAMTVAQALADRRSRRDYASRPLTADELAWTVLAATGPSSSGRRTAPSAGALYPIETYVAVRDVEGIEAGLYHVDVRDQTLERMRSGSVAGDLLVAGLGQDFLRRAPAVFVFTGVFQRTRRKYRSRHYRYVCWEGGHIAQNVYLAAEAAGLGACMVGAFFDGKLNDLLDIDGRSEAALGLVALGPR